MIKDSYANCFVPFLAPYFREIVIIDPRYYYDDLSMLVDSEGSTDVLYLYNANTFFQDTSLAPVLEAAAFSGADVNTDSDQGTTSQTNTTDENAQNSTTQTGETAEDNESSADQTGEEQTDQSNTENKDQNTDNQNDDNI